MRQEKKIFNLTLLEGEEKKKVLNIIESYRKVINKPDDLKNQWKKYVEIKSKDYLNHWSPLAYVSNRYVRAVLRRSGVNFMNKKAVSLHLNLMRCEAHHDLSEVILDKYIKR